MNILHENLHAFMHASRKWLYLCRLDKDVWKVLLRKNRGQFLAITSFRLKRPHIADGGTASTYGG